MRTHKIYGIKHGICQYFLIMQLNIFDSSLSIIAIIFVLKSLGVTVLEKYTLQHVSPTEVY